MVLKSFLTGSFLREFNVLCCFCSCCSLPTTVQFFCEVYAVCCSCKKGLVLWFLCLYLFFSVLSVLISLGFLLIRSRSVFPLRRVPIGPLCFLFFLCVLCFRCFFVF